jgi:ubiquinone/menaquinone biosynthesis C-methylase UbiE
MAGEFQIKDVLPWGRNAAEYDAMFKLNDLLPTHRVLDVGGGPASFNAEKTEKGYKVVSVDPLYQFSSDEIRSRVVETRSVMIDGVRKAKDRFVWKLFASPEDLERVRLSAMEKFLSDFDKGLSEKRYISGALPKLPFKDDAFDLVLCSHMLFMYSAFLDEAFHIASLEEMLRIAPEVRVFPLQDNNGKISKHLSAVQKWARTKAITSEIQTVGYEFQKGANEMLVLSNPI